MTGDDRIAALVKEIKAIMTKNPRVRFSAKQLNEAGNIYERYGYSMARQYLIGKESFTDKVLVQILDEIHQSNVNRVMGAYILRKLNPILNYEGGR